MVSWVPQVQLDFFSIRRHGWCWYRCRGGPDARVPSNFLARLRSRTSLRARSHELFLFELTNRSLTVDFFDP